ncbi:MAG: 4Fe-4S dicluster domain-containing protein, partial [Calditrichaeota bacterium]|nr:4Fe-4S dicluster domain-containing protein [Calditrichota bacterium]
MLPHYRFDRAKVIVGFDADFLGTWISPVEFTKDYMKTRNLSEKPPRMSYHVQIEGRLSVTGSNADNRITATTAEFGVLLNYIAAKLEEKAGTANLPVKADLTQTRVSKQTLDKIISKLWSAKGNSLVVCGANDVRLQILVNYINHLLGSYGATIDLARPSYQKLGDENSVNELIDKMNGGEVSALFIAGVNPVYSLPNGAEFKEALQKVPFSVAFTEYSDETAEHASIVCPQSHFLESWNDSEPVEGYLSITQPLISRLGLSRTLNECLSAWTGKSATDYALLQDYWKRHVFPLQKEHADFQNLWDRALIDGYVEIKRPAKKASSFNMNAVKNLRLDSAKPSGDYELVLYQKVGILDGRHAQNPWLQELPDPITKAVWDNYVSMAPQTAKRLNLRQGDVVRVSDGNSEIELPVLPQPGQHEKVIAVALGYGRNTTKRFKDIGPDWISKRPTVKEGETVGENAYRFLKWQNGFLHFSGRVNIHPTEKTRIIAQTQTYNSITVPEKLGGERRPLIRETTLKEYSKDPASGNKYKHQILQLWTEDHVYTGHHWAMVIDLSKCTGCSACVISCQAENNVPVVGKDEVYRRRELHWIRIDRYYSGPESDVEVVHQPVMCHHCDHAPCEGVCPVLATLHSDEGINQQIYNRCVGTRYCANNCPYKVRRFNWFSYRKKDEKENLVLNPDVTVRSRGIMEKCSWCVQRIQEAKAEAKRKGVKLADGDIKLACEQSCPADAIVFGDMNDPQSRISKLIHHPRHYNMLEEMNFKPTVGYLSLVRNKE